MRSGRNIFSQLPDIPPAGSELPPYISVVVPCGEDRENLITNTSFEIGLNNWSAVTGSMAHSLDYSWDQTYSLKATAGASGAVIQYSSVSVISGEVYALSAYVYFPLGGISFSISVGSVSRTFKSNGFWQRVVIVYKETATTTRNISISCTRNGSIYYIDAVQFEKCSAGKYYETTYINGDLKGFESEIVSPYYWTGAAHASTSIRISTTRSGGRVVNLRDIGFQTTVISGLGLSGVELDTMDFSILDGSQFSRQRKTNRSFTIAGRIVNSSSFQFDYNVNSLHELLDMDSSPSRNPILLKYQPMDEYGTPTGSELSIIAVYTGGLETQRNNIIGSQLTISFDQVTPTITGHHQGSTLQSLATLSSVSAIVKRSRDGVWSKLSTGIAYSVAPSNVAIDTIFIHPTTGIVYIGGLFDSAGSTSADHAAAYDPIANTFSVIKAATTFNDRVRVIKLGPDGLLYFGGDFTNADGIANADRIVRYDINANTFSAMGTGGNAGGVYDIAFLPPISANFGDLVAVGTFTLMGGVANTVRIAYWDNSGSAWSAMGTGANNTVEVVHADVDSTGDIFIVGGSFSAVGGVANTDQIAIWYEFAWHTLGNASSTVNNIVPYNNNLIFGGAFSTIGGVSSPNIALWNSNTFRQIISQNIGSVDTIITLRDRSILISAGMSFTNFPDNIGRLINSTIIPINALFPSGATALAESKSGDIYIGFLDTIDIDHDVITSVTQDGSGKSYPVFKFTSNGSFYIYGIFNYTTNQIVFFNRLLTRTNETIIMDLDPVSGFIVSDLQGDISSFMQVGSSDFWLAGGVNRISVIVDSGIVVSLHWKESFISVEDATGKI